MAKLTARNGTNDRQMWEEVYRDNCYQLPERFPPNALVFDVGAHVGYFAAACLSRGASAVRCFEPVKRNWNRLVQHMQDQERVELVHCAVVPSDYTSSRFIRLGMDEETNPAGFSPWGQLHRTLARHVDLDDQIRLVAQPIALLKLDVEGWEHQILSCSTMLHRVGTICGEWHKCPWGGRETLLATLADKGFDAYATEGESLGLFFGQRRA